MQISQTKKGEMGGWSGALIGGAIAVVIVVMTVAFGQQFLTTAGTNFAANSAAANSTNSGISGLSTFSDNIGLIALAVVLVAVIGLLLGLWYANR
jgi:lysozyme family protein